MSLCLLAFLHLSHVKFWIRFLTGIRADVVLLQAVSIVGEEVFNFKLSLFMGATEGEGYRDMSKVDGKVTMRLGCIQIVYLHKFLMSLLVS